MFLRLSRAVTVTYRSVVRYQQQLAAAAQHGW
jgi:hypothetical protein